MRVAEKLFTTRRFHEITLDEVAQQAAVGKGTIYRYFSDKDDLFFQVAIGGFEDLCCLIHHQVEQDLPFGEQLLQVCQRIQSFFAGRRQWFRLMQAEDGRMHWTRGELRERWLAQRGELVSAVARVIESGVQQGAIHSELPPDVLAQYLLGMLRAHAQDMGGGDAAGGCSGLVKLFLNGCGRCNASAATVAAAEGTAHE